MKIEYDKEADAIYIKLSSKKPTGVVEIKEGVNLDVNELDELIGIEILDASKKIKLKSFVSYELSKELVQAI